MILGGYLFSAENRKNTYKKNRTGRSGCAPSLRGGRTCSLVRLFASQAADVENNGQGAYDQTLPVQIAAAMFASQTHRQIAYHTIRGSAQAVLRFLVRSTRFS